MARNDIVLIDSILTKAKAQFGPDKDDSEVFELFCFDQVLKDLDLSFEEIKTGWTDSTNDGGVDGFFVFVDGHLVTDEDLSFALRRNPEVRVELFTVKRSDSFKQEPLNSVYSSIAELLDLTKAEDEFTYPFSGKVLGRRHLLRQTIVALADRRPQLSVQVHYCCRGDLSTLSDNLTSRAGLIRNTILDLFGDARAEVNFVGASELLAMARRQQNYSLRLKFIETYISREGGNYIVLASLPSYFKFITDEEGKLRRYLFESNVREYLGRVQVNQDIRSTLDTKKSANEEDFWWFNNGVTILATHANVVGKEISIENVQIVNGLQTTETIYKFYTEQGMFEDSRAILIKVLLAGDETIRDRIIKATNYQSNVDLSSLRGLDTIQRDIEHHFFDNGWYYDRRKNFYKNQGRPANRIISIGYLAAAVRAVALGDPVRSQRQRSRSLRVDDVYRQVFSTKWDLDVYLASLEITNAVETIINSMSNLTEPPPIALVHFIAYIYACDKLGKTKYRPQEVARLVGNPPTIAEVDEIWNSMKAASNYQDEPGKRYEGIKLNRSFVERFARQRFHKDAAVHATELTNVSRLPDSYETPQSKEELMLSFNQAKEADTPLNKIVAACTVLVMAAKLLSDKDAPQMSVNRILLQVAKERHVSKDVFDASIKMVYSYHHMLRSGDTEFTEADANDCLSALSRLLYYTGLKADP